MIAAELLAWAGAMLAAIALAYRMHNLHTMDRKERRSIFHTGTGDLELVRRDEETWDFLFRRARDFQAGRITHFHTDDVVDTGCDLIDAALADDCGEVADEIRQHTGSIRDLLVQRSLKENPPSNPRR